MLVSNQEIVAEVLENERVAIAAHIFFVELARLEVGTLDTEKHPASQFMPLKVSLI